MRILLKKDLEWISKAAFDGKISSINIHDDFAIGLDGYRIHLIGENLPDYLDGLNVKDVISQFDNASVISSAIINAKYLIDALSGMRDQEVTLSILKRSKDDIAVKIESVTSDKQAIIMCIEEAEKDE